jgi:hypothetical protein
MSNIEDHTKRAIVDRLLRHTAGIVNDQRLTGTDPATGRRADEEQPGTGCFIRWGGSHAIITARHVVENAGPKNVRVFSYPAGGFKIQESDEVTFQDVVEAVRLASDATIHLCSWEDIAVLTVAPDAFPGAEFVDVGTDWTDPSEGESISCCGFPSDYRVTLGKTQVGNRENVEIGLYPLVFSGDVLPPPTEDELKFKITGFDASRHYLIHYPTSLISKHPGGISGAAAWWESREQGLVWRPNFKFAGLCEGCYKGGTVIQVIKASGVRKYLNEVFV